jgi:hypothetical protein
MNNEKTEKIRFKKTELRGYYKEEINDFYEFSKTFPYDYVSTHNLKILMEVLSEYIETSNKNKSLESENSFLKEKLNEVKK